MRAFHMAAAAIAVCIFAASAAAQQIITPRQAVEMAADAAPSGVPGKFVLTVRATGSQDGDIFLNSENDYRDQRNITIVIDPLVEAAILKAFGVPADAYFAGKKIAVTGEAKRVKIYFFCEGRQTEKYYYQTHVVLTGPDHIEVLPADAK